MSKIYKTQMHCGWFQGIAMGVATLGDRALIWGVAGDQLLANDLVNQSGQSIWSINPVNQSSLLKLKHQASKELINSITQSLTQSLDHHLIIT